MTRKILCLCLAVLLLVSMMGCGTGAPVETAPETTASLKNLLFR